MRRRRRWSALAAAMVLSVYLGAVGVPSASAAVTSCVKGGSAPYSLIVTLNGNDAVIMSAPPASGAGADLSVTGCAGPYGNIESLAVAGANGDAEAVEFFDAGDTLGGDWVDVTVTVNLGASATAEADDEVWLRRGPGADTIDAKTFGTYAGVETLRIDGGPGADHLKGTDGDDTLEGGPDIDVLDGRLGDDTFVREGEGSVDVIIGGLGDDTVDYSESGGGVRIVLDPVTGPPVTSADTFDGTVERLIGSLGADEIYGTARSRRAGPVSTSSGAESRASSARASPTACPVDRVTTSSRGSAATTPS